MNKSKILIALFFVCSVAIVAVGAIAGLAVSTPAQAAVGTPIPVKYNLGPAISASTDISTCQTFSNPAVLSPPDEDPTGVSSSVTVDMSGYVSYLTVSTSVTHPYPSDLLISFCQPAGGNCILDYYDMSYQPCVNCQLTFDDNAAGYIWDAVPPYGGTYIPDTSGPYAYPVYQPLVKHLPAKGVYTLHVQDDSGADTGTLGGWSMTLCTVPSPPTRTPTPTRTPPPTPTNTPAPTATPVTPPTPHGPRIFDCYTKALLGTTSYDVSVDNVPACTGYYDFLGCRGICVDTDYPNSLQVSASYSEEAYGQAVSIYHSFDPYYGYEGPGGACPTATTSTTTEGFCTDVKASNSCTWIWPNPWPGTSVGAAGNILANSAPGLCGSYSAHVELHVSMVEVPATPTNTPLPTNTPRPTSTITPTPSRTPTVTPCATVSINEMGWWIW